MDPNEVLRQLRVYLELPGRWYPMEEYNARRLLTNLDEWLSKGGFLPAEWGRDRQTLTSIERSALDAFRDKVARKGE